MLEVKVTYSGMGETGPDPAILDLAFDQVTGKLSDFRPFLESSASVFELNVQQQFLSQGSHFGAPWPPLAESTIARREHTVRRMGKTLMVSRRSRQHWAGLAGEANFQALSGGRLQESFTRDGEDHVEDYTPTQLMWGSAVPNRNRTAPLARIHHFGAEHLPARPIIVLDRMAGQIRDAMAEYLTSDGVITLSGEQTEMGFTPAGEGAWTTSSGMAWGPLQ